MTPRNSVSLWIDVIGLAASAGALAAALWIKPTTQVLGPLGAMLMVVFAVRLAKRFGAEGAGPS